ncbi:MAG TPA: DUF397 domain-containing protein [Streptosporangiaceae bacterium]|nr:DUF397 domain-containing protein [Streptosporangiaceae bacterium]
MHHQPESQPDLTGATWRKSSYSGTSGNCVEVATNLPGLVAIRDSKDPEGPKLVVSVSEWQSFVAGVQAGEFGG